MAKSKLILVAMLGISVIMFSGVVCAQEEKKVDYRGEVIVDSDLDGLTDEGERQFFNTDPQKEDSDGDGISDGAEVLGGVAAEKALSEIGGIGSGAVKETPWAWYVSRISALVGFALLYFSMFLGLAIRIPSLRNLIGSRDTFAVHCWISLQALLLALIHGVALAFDKFIGFSLADVFIPFAAEYETYMVALGIIAFYLMLILVVSSYLKNRMPHKLWRALHFFNIVLYIFSVIHAWQLGTDLASDLARAFFVAINAVLVALVLWHIVERIRCRVKKTQECDVPQA